MFNAVTWVIEMEKAYIYISENASRNQIEKCIEKLNSSNSEGKVGIYMYVPELDECVLLNEDSELADPKTAIEYLRDEFGERIEKEDGTDNERNFNEKREGKEPEF